MISTGREYIIPDKLKSGNITEILPYLSLLYDQLVILLGDHPHRLAPDVP